MQLEAVPETGAVRASFELGQRVLPKRIHAAQRAKSTEVLRDLLGGPVVLGPHLCVFVVTPQARATQCIRE